MKRCSFLSMTSKKAVFRAVDMQRLTESICLQPHQRNPRDLASAPMTSRVEASTSVLMVALVVPDRLARSPLP